MQTAGKIVEDYGKEYLIMLRLVARVAIEGGTPFSRTSVEAPDESWLVGYDTPPLHPWGVDEGNRDHCRAIFPGRCRRHVRRLLPSPIELNRLLCVVATFAYCIYLLHRHFQTPRQSVGPLRCNIMSSRSCLGNRGDLIPLRERVRVCPDGRRSRRLSMIAV